MNNEKGKKVARMVQALSDDIAKEYNKQVFTKENIDMFGEWLEKQYKTDDEKTNRITHVLIDDIKSNLLSGNKIQFVFFKYIKFLESMESKK